MGVRWAEHNMLEGGDLREFPEICLEQVTLFWRGGGAGIMDVSPAVPQDQKTGHVLFCTVDETQLVPSYSSRSVPWFFLWHFFLRWPSRWNKWIVQVNAERTWECWPALGFITAVESVEEAVFQECYSLGWPGSPCVSWQYAWQRHHTLLIGSSFLSCPASSNRFPLCSCITTLPSASTGARNGIGWVQLFPLGFMFSCSCPSIKSGISFRTCV